MTPASLAPDGVGQGTVVDRRYIVQQEIGRGNMATVYLATDELAGREVALKIMHARLLGRPDKIERFFNEHRFATRIGPHENIVATLADGRVNGTGGAPYLVMERVVGVSLDVLRALERDFGTERIARLVLGVANGLRAVHEAGVVHRDVKPGNVLVARTDDGVEIAKLLDFGLAVDLQPTGPGSAAGRLTLAGQLPGSAGYMPPEAVSYATPHPAADVFGLGVLLAETTIGRQPYDGVGRDEYLADIAREDWSFPGRVLDRIESPTLRALVRDCTRREPEARPPIDEVIQRLAAVVFPAAAEGWADVAPVPGEPSEPPGVLGLVPDSASPATAKTPTPARRTSVWIAVGLIGFGLVAALGLWLGAQADDDGATLPGTTASEPDNGGAATSAQATSIGPGPVVPTDVTDEAGSHDIESTGGVQASSSDAGDGEAGSTSGGQPASAQNSPKRRPDRHSPRKGTTSGTSNAAETGEPDPGPDAAQCAAVRRSIETLRESGAWPRIPFLAKGNRPCFDAREYRRIRVEAFAESGQNAECVAAAGNSRDPQVQAWADQCKENQ